MSKTTSGKSPGQDNMQLCKSSFTLTFAFEVLGPETWQGQDFRDIKDDTIELGPCEYGFRAQYQLYYNGCNFDVEVAIWPNVAKVCCGQETCWIRVWPFLESRWLTFSIRHAFPVRVVEFRSFEVQVSPSVGVGVISSNAKGDKASVVTIPPLAFGERRYFGKVINNTLTEDKEWLKFVRDFIWSLVEDFIPKSFLDGKFDAPMTVTDVRHQDTILAHIQDTVLNRNLPNKEANSLSTETVFQRIASSQKTGKEKESKKKGGGGDQKIKFGLKLTGDAILAGAGRIVAFEPFGQRPPDMGEIIILISSTNLPAQDDLPIAFVNIETLLDVPMEEMRKLRITHLYTRWSLGDEVHDSEPVDVRSRKLIKDVNFNDHHSLPLELNKATEITAQFIDNVYEIQLRGIRELEPVVEQVKLYGYDKRDREYESLDNAVTTDKDQEVDFIIATTRIDTRTLCKGVNGFLRGEYPLFPPQLEVTPLEREASCTNDINLIGAALKPRLVVPASLILTAQMTLEVSMGIVGCKPPRLTSCFSRLYFLSTDSESVMAILLKVSEINEFLRNQNNKEEMLTGFVLDTGDITCFFLEGPRDRHILTVWDLTEEFYPKVKPLFSSAARYSSRIYEGMLLSVPFIVLKMHVPLQVLLACPAVYARPALPLPARIATLKFGRLIQNYLRSFPSMCELPSLIELKSFRLELCAPPRTFPVLPQTSDSAAHGNEQSPGNDNKLTWLPVNQVNKNIVFR